MLKKLKEWTKEILLLICLGFVGGLFIPPALRMVDRYRFAGLWHVDGTMENWRFGNDGTFRNESLVALEGSYSLLPHGRIDITTGWNGTTRYIYQFDGVGLSLTAEGQRSGYRLVRKD